MANGEKGDKGDQGDKGDPGRSIAKTELVNGELIITYSDGEVVNLGKLVENEGSDGLDYYPLPDGTYGVRMGRTEFLETVTIPATHNGIPVTQILPMAFAGMQNLKTIVIPTGITVIGESAFSGCRNLTNVELPDHVTSIGSFAFAYCDSLADIVVPDSVTTLGVSAFQGCIGLASVTLGNGMTSINADTFSGCVNLLSIEIPESVTDIGGGAFTGCSSLTSIIIPDSVTSIGEYIFSNCTGLVNITLGDGLTYIFPRMFVGCESLASVVLPASLTEIPEYAFEGCASLTSIDIPNRVTLIREYAFTGCSSLTSIIIPDSVTSVGEGMFSGCTGLVNVTLGNGLTSIPSHLFAGCESLTNIVWPSSLATIPEWTFANCSSLTSIVIPDSVTAVYRRAFAGCSALESISIPRWLTMSHEAFDFPTLKTVVYRGTKAEWREERATMLWLENILKNGSVLCIDGYASIDDSHPAYMIDANMLHTKMQEGYVNHIGSFKIMTEDNRVYTHIVPNDFDPSAMIIQPEDGLNVPQYMAISYRTNNTRGSFFLSSENDYPTGTDCVNQTWIGDGAWHLAVIDLTSLGQASISNGRIKYLRMDFLENPKLGSDYFDVEYIAFFESEDAVRSYDTELHLPPQWDLDKEVVRYQSFDELIAYASLNHGFNIFNPGHSQHWNHKADLSQKTASTLRYWGWLAVMGGVGRFGYSINAGEAIFDDAWTVSAEQPVIDAAMSMGADNGIRMDIMIDLEGLKGENTVYVYYENLRGERVLLERFTVILPERPTNEHYIPLEQWTVSGHCPQIATPDHTSFGAMVAAGGVTAGALLHQGAIYLGELDLSKYSKVVIYYGIDSSQFTVDNYNQNVNNRIMLLSADMNMQMSPAEEDIIVGATYLPQGWAVVRFEIDLTEVDYSGPVYVTWDTLPGTFMLISDIAFVSEE